MRLNGSAERLRGIALLVDVRLEWAGLICVSTMNGVYMHKLQGCLADLRVRSITWFITPRSGEVRQQAAGEAMNRKRKEVSIERGDVMWLAGRTLATPATR